MGINDELDKLIEQEMASLDKKEYQRSGRSYNDFVKEYTGILAQSDEDDTVLTDAGFDSSQRPKYYGYLAKLTMEHGERIVAEGDESDAVKEFDTMMPKARLDKRVLMAVGRYIVTRTEDRDDKRVYDLVRKGHGDVDTLSDNVTMSSFTKKHPELAEQVRPGGQVIDALFLDRVEADALKLLKLKGAADAARDDTMDQVDRQNRLITLCVNAEREIKLFAEMAFFDDVERYNRFYASAARRAKQDQNDEIPESDTEQDN